MSSNPYENPYQPAPGGNFAGGGGPPSGNASELVNMPATLLLVAGGLGVAAHILGILLNILGVSMMGALLRVVLTRRPWSLRASERSSEPRSALDLMPW